MQQDSTQSRTNLRSALLATCAILTLCGQPLSAQIDVRVRTVAKDPIVGRLISLSGKDGAALVLADGDRQRIAFDDIVQIQVIPKPSPAVPRGFTIVLGQGDVLHGQLDDGDAESLVVQTLDIGRVTLPLERIARIDAARARESSFRDSVEWLDRTPSSDEDRILLTNGDVIRGFITSVGADGMVIESTLGMTPIPRATIVAARFASPMTARPQSRYQIVSLRNSGHLSIREIDWSDDVVTGVSPGGKIMIEAERITGVELFGGRWEWLSHHTPISYQHTPMLATSRATMPAGWDYVRDRNVRGNALSVAGKTYARGIGVHSRASLTFDLGGKFRDFVTRFGMDDDSGPYADVSVSILINGRPRYRQQHVRRGKLHEAVRLDVTGAKRIELIVDFGDNGDIQDRFNWIEPALIR